MSYLARSFRLPRTLRLQPFTLTSISSLHTTRSRFAMSESDHGAHDQKDTPDRNAKIDEHKNDSVTRAADGKGEWKPELASNSEQGIKADKHDMSTEEMQKHGAAKAEKGAQPAGTGPDGAKP